MLSEKSKIEELPKSRESPFLAASVCCKPQQDTYEALWSISCDTMWPPTSARVRRAGGVEKFSSPVRKTFFDSIGHSRRFRDCPRGVRSTPNSGRIAASRQTDAQG